jgi:hypothetical protein
MTTSVLLYAWANPVPATLWDHTWVTTYDNRAQPYPDIGKVVAHGEDYWFCWGTFHMNGSTPQHRDGFLGAMTGDLAVARCLVQSNVACKPAKPSCGAIFYYGIDGVCHQLANQVLWATKGPVAGPLTVSNARGYHVSSFAFGTYGRQPVAWKDKQETCGPPLVSSVGTDDEFEVHARQVLSGAKAADKLQALLNLRAQLLAEISGFRDRVRTKNAPSAEELNRVYNDYFARAAKLLGREDYRKVFGVPAGEAPSIVDPAMMPASTRRKAAPKTRTRK